MSSEARDIVWSMLVDAKRPLSAKSLAAICGLSLSKVRGALRSLRDSGNVEWFASWYSNQAYTRLYRIRRAPKESL